MADLIAKRQIDVLVDLGGHTAHNRLMEFARRPAPIQASYLGYPNTTGLPLSTMQYRFTDLVADPLGTSDGMHTERLVRLPGTFLCYKPPADAPDVGAEASNASHVTFGCFNAIQKLSFTMLDLWASLLREVPGSRIILKGRSLGDRSVCEAILERFAGVDFHRDRVVFLARDESTRSTSGALFGNRHRVGYVTVQRNNHHLRGAVDGCSGGHSCRQFASQPRRREHSVGSGVAGAHCAQYGTVPANCRKSS